VIRPEILPVELQVTALVVQGLFLAWVVRLIRARRLSLRDSLLWLLSTLAALAFTAFPGFLVAGAKLAGIQVPSNALFGAGLLYVAVNVLAVTIASSANAARTRTLAQECALLRADLEALRRGEGQEAGGPGRAGAPGDGGGGGPGRAERP